MGMGEWTRLSEDDYDSQRHFLFIFPFALLDSNRLFRYLDSFGTKTRMTQKDKQNVSDSAEEVIGKLILRTKKRKSNLVSSRSRKVKKKNARDNQKDPRTPILGLFRRRTITIRKLPSQH